MSQREQPRRLGRPPRPYPTVLRPPNAFAIWWAKRVEEGQTLADFMRLFRVSHQTLYAWRIGTRAPPLSRAIAIEHITNGDVPVKSWK